MVGSLGGVRCVWWVECGVVSGVCVGGWSVGWCQVCVWVGGVWGGVRCVWVGGVWWVAWVVSGVCVGGWSVGWCQVYVWVGGVWWVAWVVSGICVGRWSVGWCQVYVWAGGVRGGVRYMCGQVECGVVSGVCVVGGVWGVVRGVCVQVCVTTLRVDSDKYVCEYYKECVGGWGAFNHNCARVVNMWSPGSISGLSRKVWSETDNSSR